MAQAQGVWKVPQLKGGQYPCLNPIPVPWFTWPTIVAVEALLLLARLNHDPWYGILILGLSQGFLVFVVVRSFGYRMISPALSRLISREEGVSAYPVSMTILKHDNILGISRGWIWLREDCIEFKGLYTEFRLDRKSIEIPYEEFANGPLISSTESQWRFGNHTGRNAWGFRLTSMPNLRIHIFPLQSKRSFYNDFYNWGNEASKHDCENEILPPIMRMPGYQKHSVFTLFGLRNPFDKESKQPIGA